MNGYELCQKLRQDGLQIPIIFLTALLDPENIVRAFEAGGNDYISKPFNKIELLARVKNHITLAKLQQECQTNLKNALLINEMQTTVLMEREKMAQMGDTFSMIAHQWKQPLSTISIICSYVEMQKEFDLHIDEEILGYFKTINSKVKHLSETVDMYKKFFKPTQSKESASLKDLIDNALIIYQELILFHTITIETHYDTQPVINVISNEIIQAILILIQNSIDVFISEKIKGRIDLTVTQDDESVLIHFQDNAGGIPEAIMNHVFEMNYTTKGISGSGIGLYMAKTIIEDHHHGRLTVINKGDGAEFTLQIPIGAEDVNV